MRPEQLRDGLEVVIGGSLVVHIVVIVVVEVVVAHREEAQIVTNHAHLSTSMGPSPARFRTPRDGGAPRAPRQIMTRPAPGKSEIVPPLSPSGHR